MTKETMIRTYRKYSKADSYILGFIDNHNIYMIKVKEIMPRYLVVEKASRNQGENLRLRIRKEMKKELINKGAELIGTEEMLVATKYNKGEIFEKLVTEYYGQNWTKDNIPFYVSGDIRVGNEEIQIKLDSATLLNTNQVKRIKTLDF